MQPLHATEDMHFADAASRDVFRTLLEDIEEEGAELLLLTVRTEHQDKLDLLNKIGQVYGEQLGDADKAFAAYAEAFTDPRFAWRWRAPTHGRSRPAGHPSTLRLRARCRHG